MGFPTRPAGGEIFARPQRDLSQSGNHGNGRAERLHGMEKSMLGQGWLNVLAYFALWAFCIMATYYVERLLVQRRKRAVC